MFNRFIKSRNSKKGFTLIEVMVVVAIVAVLAAVAIPAYLAYKEDAKRAVARSSLMAIIDSMNGFYHINKGSLSMVSSADGGTISGTIGDVLEELGSDENQLSVVVDGIKRDAPIDMYCVYDADVNYFMIKSGVSNELWEALYDDGTPYVNPVG